MGGKRGASPVKRLNVSHSMIKSTSSDSVFELWEMLFECMKCIQKVQPGKTFLSSSISSDWKSSHGQVVFEELIKHTQPSITIHLHQCPPYHWQVHNKASSVCMRPIWYCGPYPWTLWCCVKCLPLQRLPRKTEKSERERSEVANCWILANMKQGGRSSITIIIWPWTPWIQNGLIIVLCEWWRYFVAPQTVTPNLQITLKQLLVCYFDFLFVLAYFKQHRSLAMRLWKEFYLSRNSVFSHVEV